MTDMVNKGLSNRGDKVATAKLTWPLVRQIRSDPRSTYKIARDYGVSQKTIDLIKRGITWVEGNN